MQLPRLLPLALAALTLVACRPKIAPIDAPEPVTKEAAPPPSLTVCWVESGRFGPATASALVIRHPAGTVLVDAGDSSQFDAEIEVYRGRERRRLKHLPGLLRPKVPFDDQLREIGVDPEGIAWFIPTHAPRRSHRRYDRHAQNCP